jgi:hypothetical protein
LGPNRGYKIARLFLTVLTFEEVSQIKPTRQNESKPRAKIVIERKYPLTTIFEGFLV